MKLKCLCVAIIASGFANVAFAQSSKVAAVAGEVAAIPNDGQFHTIFFTDIRTSKQKDLFMQVNMECALETETLVSNQNNFVDSMEDFVTDTSTAEAQVQVQVLIDGQRVAEPGAVTFCQRKQEQEALFGGIIYGCADANGDGVTDVTTECQVADEQLRLLLETMTANSFGFILDDLGAARHQIEVQAAITTNEEFEQGAATANAYIGHGSITVEEVRLEKNADISF